MAKRMPLPPEPSAEEPKKEPISFSRGFAGVVAKIPTPPPRPPLLEESTSVVTATEEQNKEEAKPPPAFLLKKEALESNANSLSMLPITEIHPSKYQVRAITDTEHIETLMCSITESGVISPIVVRPLPKMRIVD